MTTSSLNEQEPSGVRAGRTEQSVPPNADYDFPEPWLMHDLIDDDHALLIAQDIAAITTALIRGLDSVSREGAIEALRRIADLLEFAVVARSGSGEVVWKLGNFAA